MKRAAEACWDSLRSAVFCREWSAVVCDGLKGFAEVCKSLIRSDKDYRGLLRYALVCF